MLSLTLALLLGSVQTPAAGDGILVTGTRYSPAQARARATEFVDRMGIGAGDRPVARWGEAVCPRVQGIEPRLAAHVERRMRATAAAAGIEVAPEGCRSNIVVHFTSDADRVMNNVAARSSGYVDTLSPQDREAMLNGNAPVRWVYGSETRGRHGMRAMTGGDLPSVAIDGGAGGSALGNIPSVVSYNSSMVSTQAVRLLTSAVVVIDADSSDGRQLDSIADYASFVAFAEVRLGDPAPRGSILSLFDQDGRADELTGWDRAFLTALYRIPLDRMGRRHRGLLVRELVQAASAAGRP